MFKNHHNANKFAKNMEVVDTSNPSLTIPNQSMTIQEIYQRFASGRSLSGVKSPIYDDDGSGKLELSFDDYLPNLATLDLADRQSIIENAKEQLDEVKKRLNAVASAKKQAQKKRQEDADKKIKELEERISTFTDKSSPKNKDPE